MILSVSSFALSFTVMVTQDEYLRKAAECQKQADMARFDFDREAWLRLAQSWMSMVKHPQSVAEASDRRDEDMRRKESQTSNTPARGTR
jgi:hypothetical protein